jgi:hypothetical protein
MKVKELAFNNWGPWVVVVGCIGNASLLGPLHIALHCLTEGTDEDDDPSI